ncbi:HAL/PAL/TAL family ammonia-lyase [Streptacidiphilus jiangxiensis]|uniref:Histidine ammonia-lyase/phenylalanine ammonia-lyase n=1 Tax=Streptacidiphilus jiangxiensis TaxID=235985 RepID=A0A1H7VNU7_STRJI|nr:aromatic amino acid ammonia-lyase [Streptacidiphilus jiangxiensis]SEM10468.1 histidine ammonia-lyase/phenylalanine ammonia-lyase [Streptacidiphilus jiangxiensis]
MTGPANSLPPQGITLDGRSLSSREVAWSARGDAAANPVRLSEESRVRMRASVALKHTLLEQEIPIYGVTTGFGDSCSRQISPDKAAELQRNLVLYHLNGTGPAAVREVARATMLIRANALSRGPSAIRPEVVETLLAHLGRDVLPLIPERGSLGASGDLVPLCYLAAALIGEGEVSHRGTVRPALDALAEEGLEPVRLEPKEGIALINGTSFTAAYGALAAWDAQELAFVAELATAMTLEALRGNASAMHAFVHDNKPHPGQVESARTVRTLLDGSKLATSFEDILLRRERLSGRGFVQLREPVQEKYSVRCAPQIIGIVHDTLEWVERWLGTEINSSSDNPLFDAEEGGLHLGGNFYAGHVGHAMDALKVTVAGLADLLDRQLALVVDEKFNNGLSPNLIVARDPDDPQAGLHHGFKGMQIAASAITAEALKQSNPASVFSRSTEAHNQDKVSMGTIAARDARTVSGLVREVAAIHLLALAQAIDLRGIDLASPAIRSVHALIREHSPFVDRDRRLDCDVKAVIGLIESGALRRAAGLADADFVAGRRLDDVASA